jgi:hypothetical protein
MRGRLGTFSHAIYLTNTNLTFSFMKKLVLPLVLGCALIAVSCGHKQSSDQSAVTSSAEQSTVAPDHKYGVKSGILILKIENNLMKMNMERHVYFDNYGAKEAAEVYKDGQLVEKTMNMGDGFMYHLNLVNKAGTKTGNQAANGTELKFDIGDYAWPEKARKEYNFTKLPNETIAGKDCEVYSTESTGMKAKYAGWNGILFLLTTESPMGKGTMKTETTAADFKENADIPASVWEIPAAIAMKEQ